MSDGSLWALSTTPLTNGTTLNGINIAEGCPTANLNDSIRQLCAAVVGANLVVATSGTDTYTATLAPAPQALVDGMTIQIRFGNANATTTPSLNINGLGAKTVTKNGGVALAAGDIPAGHEAQLRYVSGSTTWVLMNPLDELGNVSAASGTAGQSAVVNTAGTAYVLAGPLYGFKNRLVNPAMLIDQANEKGAVTLASGAPQFIADQWHASFTQTGAAGTTMAQVVADAPAALGSSGQSLKFTMGTGHSISAGDFGAFSQNIEAYNVADLQLGAAGALATSHSFWIKSSLTAPTFTLFLTNSGTTRSYLFNFTLTGTNTWQRITVPNIPGDTTGTWLNNTNGIGLEVGICFSAGSTFQGTNAAWTAGNFLGTSATTNLMATTAATVQITGVQTEVGPAVTAFEPRAIDREIVLCQRFYEKSYNIGIAVGAITNVGMGATLVSGLPSAIYQAGILERFRVTKRATPTVTMYSPVDAVSGKVYDFVNAADVNAPLLGAGEDGFLWAPTASAPNTAYEFHAHWTADARL